MCPGQWYVYKPGTNGLRIVRLMSKWKSRKVDRQKRDDKNQVMDVMREDYRLTGREVGDMLGIGESSV